MKLRPKSSFAPYEMASPTLLSEQPTTMVREETERNFDWDAVYTHLESRLNAMKDWRYSWWTYWSKLAEYILPRRYRWLVTANLMRRGTAINQSIVDGTAVLAKNICYTGMVDGLCPTTRSWVRRAVARDDYQLDSAGKAYLETCDRRVEIILAKSNFYPTIAQVAEDEVVFGTGPLIAYEHAENIVWFDNPCAGEYYLSVGGHNGVDTLYSEQTKTVEALVDFFQLENCPQTVRDLWERGGGSLQQEFVLCRAIEPNFAISGRGRSKGKSIDVVPGGFPFREVYWLRGNKGQKPMSVRGFTKRPFGAFRWATTGNDPYGRGPGMDGLGDAIQLQIMTRRLNEAIEKQVRPPMGADPAMKNEPASINPGHITYVDTSGGKKGFWNLFEVKLELAAMMKVIEQIWGRLDRYFMVDVFMAISRMEGVQPRQNMEIAARKAEAMQRLGPVIGLWKTEMTTILERVYDICERRGAFPPKPASLKNIPFKFDFLDMVTLAQLGSETAAMEETFRVGGELSEAAKSAGLPDPLRNINLDEAMRIYADRMNFPAKALFTDREVKRLDMVRRAATQKNQIIAATQPVVDAATSLAKIPPQGGNSMLGQLMGGGGASLPPPGPGLSG